MPTMIFAHGFGATSTLAGKAMTWAGVSALGGSFLWYVAIQIGPPTGTVVVHVSETDVTVSIGEESCEIGARLYVPLIFEVSRGEHQLVMARGDEIIDRQTFRVRGGESVILTAWIPPGPDLDSQPWRPTETVPSPDPLLRPEAEVKCQQISVGLVTGGE